jgi:hypothetical protein
MTRNGAIQVSEIGCSISAIGSARGVQEIELRVGLPTVGEEGRKFSMSKSLPMHYVLMVFAGWLNRHQQAVIEYLQTENEILN